MDYKSKSIIWIESSRLVKTMIIDLSWRSSLGAERMLNYIQRKVLFELPSASGSLLDLTLDWVSNILYYSYTDASINIISATNFPSIDYHFTIFTSKLDKATSLAVNPRLKYLYWIDQGQFAKLERSNLDGSDRTVLISTDISSPTDLFVDHRTGFVYWSDNIKDRIERCNFDGTARITIKSTGLPNPVSIYTDATRLFFTDSRLQGIFSINLTNFNASNSPGSTPIKRFKDVELKDILIFSESIQALDIDSPCKVNQCSQLCFALPGQGSLKCGCGIGELDSNGRDCKRPKEYLIFAMENEIRGVNLPMANSDLMNLGMPWRPLTGLNMTIGIDFDFRDNRVIFTDVAEKKIAWFMVTNDNPVIEDVIKRNMSLARDLIGRPEGVAYDWVTDTIYYTDDEINLVSSYKISNGQRVVIGYSGSPRAIVVHPCKGYLFWSDVGIQPGIIRTSLAGNNYQRIVRSDIRWPNGLAIDFDEDKLYWADAFYDRIERSDFEGNYRQVITTGKL